MMAQYCSIGRSYGGLPLWVQIQHSTSLGRCNSWMPNSAKTAPGLRGASGRAEALIRGNLSIDGVRCDEGLTDITTSTYRLPDQEVLADFYRGSFFYRMISVAVPEIRHRTPVPAYVCYRP